jgi:hypothetical protein
VNYVKMARPGFTYIRRAMQICRLLVCHIKIYTEASTAITSCGLKGGVVQRWRFERSRSRQSGATQSAFWARDSGMTTIVTSMRDTLIRQYHAMGMEFLKTLN